MGKKLSFNEEKNTDLVVAIKVFQAKSGYSRDDIAKCLGFTTQTLGNKLRNPDTITYGELKNLFRLMKLPEEQKAALV